MKAAFSDKRNGDDMHVHRDHSTSQRAITDPVCGMTVSPDTAAGFHEHNGETYYFCSTHCLTKFREDPERFINKSSEVTTAQAIKHEPQSAPAQVVHLYLSNAPGSDARETGLLSKMRHGTRTSERYSAATDHRIHLSNASANRAGCT